MNINESISVTTHESGSPLAFTWRSTRYVVVSEPEPWFKKKPWWHASGNVLTIPHASLEKMLWRVTALPCIGPRSLHSDAPEEGLYDLTSLPNGEWLLVDAHTHTLDISLFA